MHDQNGQGNEQLASCAKDRWRCRPGSERASARPGHAWRCVGLIAVLLAGVLSLVDGRAATAADVKLATLDWPPYTSPTLPQNGMVSKILAQAAQESGYSLGFGFFPWVRAM